MENKTKRTNMRSGFTLGLLLLLIGFGLILTNTGVIPWEIRRVILTWPMILVGIGLISLYNREYPFGLVMIGVGGFFLLPKLRDAFPEEFWFIPADFTSTYWPILLIIAGVVVIACAFLKPKKSYYNMGCQNYNKNKKQYHHTTGEGYFEKSTVFGESKHIILEPRFLGGKATSIFGSMTLDLRRSEIPEGETHLHVEIVFGNITVIVPPDSKIKPEVSTIFSEFSDKRVISEAVESNRLLIITGETVFGNLEVRD